LISSSKGSSILSSSIHECIMISLPNIIKSSNIKGTQWQENYKFPISKTMDMWHISKASEFDGYCILSIL
jgi:hypothetical protein